MAQMLFCHVGWMSRYEGLVGKPDKIVGGGSWVAENGTGGEVCNFVACRDGYVYGHVETMQGERDRKIRIEAVGGTGEFVNGIDLIWTATHPDEGGRRVIGWYRNATVFRQRQEFRSPPSKQHARDELTTYRIRALAKDASLLDINDRELRLEKKPGWMGHTQWWSPSESDLPEIGRFIRRTRRLLEVSPGSSAKGPNPAMPTRTSPSASRDAYIRYVDAYETQITPRHNALQERFERFIASAGATELRPNFASVDFRYRDPRFGIVLTEIKPCERINVRYAIRTAMGQLLDYHQRAKDSDSLLIVLEQRPTEQDCLLATSNGFGVAYPFNGKFDIVWPPNPASEIRVR